GLGALHRGQGRSGSSGRPRAGPGSGARLLYHQHREGTAGPRARAAFVIHPAVRDLFQTLARQEAFQELLSKLLRREPGPYSLAGLTPTAKSLYLVLLWQACERPLTVLTDGNQSAELLCELIETFFDLLVGRPEVGRPQLLPAPDVLPGQGLSMH